MAAAAARPLARRPLPAEQLGERPARRPNDRVREHRPSASSPVRPSDFDPSAPPPWTLPAVLWSYLLSG
jgi:hypothetical protein